jgi:hypothetical protein
LLTTFVSAPYPADVLFYGVVSAQTEKVVEFFLEREAAEAMIGEVRAEAGILTDDDFCACPAFRRLVSARREVKSVHC